MEEVALFTLAGIARLLVYIFWEFLFQVVCYLIGKGTIFVFSLGRIRKDRQTDENPAWVATLGLVMVVLAWVAVVIFNRYIAA